jgi:hypothetical protein
VQFVLATVGISVLVDDPSGSTAPNLLIAYNRIICSFFETNAAFFSLETLSFVNISVHL